MKRGRTKLIVLILASVCALTAVYYRIAVWPLGSVSKFETVNDAHWFNQIELALDQESYAPDTQWIMLHVKNNAQDGSLLLSDGGFYCNWCLEKQVDGVWRTQRTITKSKRMPTWHLSPRNGDLNSLGPSGIVYWGGKEEVFEFGLTYFYETPLETGTYRIIIPNCDHGSLRGDICDIAVEFEVK